MVKKENAKVSTISKHSSPHKEFYSKLAVIGVIVVLVIGVFLFAGLKGAGKASWYKMREKRNFSTNQS